MKERSPQEEIDARHSITVVRVMMTTLRVMAILFVIGVVVGVVYRKPLTKFVASLPPEKYISAGTTVKHVPVDKQIYRTLQHHECTVSANRNGTDENFTGIPVKFLFTDPAGPGYAFTIENRDEIAIRYRPGGRWCTCQQNARSMLNDSPEDVDLLILETDGSLKIVSPAFFPLDGGYYPQVERLDVLRSTR